MAISRYMYRPDQTGKPKVGDLVRDPNTLLISVFDGSSWIVLDDDAVYMEPNQVQSMIDDLLNHKDRISDEYLERHYPDLKMMRKTYEEEYALLRDKYKVFEILKVNGVNT